MIIILIILALVVLMLIFKNKGKDTKYSKYVPPPKEDYRYVETSIPNAEKTKVGHVYIISNIGSFGEGVYKIGMTRKDDPLDRVKELGDASVPFLFDVHVIISTPDAPELESRIQKILIDKRVNQVNKRKEFFRVELQELKDILTAEGIDLTDFVDIPKADQFRKSKKIWDKIFNKNVE